jgi:ferric-dicitrate binding protein FerR (iron transport regulator)
MVTNDTDRLLARYFAGELSPQDKIRLEKWLTESQENEDYFFELTSLYQNVGTTDYPSFHTQEAFEKLEEHINQQHQEHASPQKDKRKLLIWTMGAAAAIALLVVIFNRGQDDTYTAITEKRLYSFADSTKIDLMDGEIYLSKNQVNDTIFLKGKASFEMESEKTGSKIVKAGNVYVKDIGTSFTIDANIPDSVYVNVTEGEVLFYSDTDAGIRLKMNESGYYLSRSNKFYKVVIKGNFRFNETSLGEVITRLNAFYGQQIELESEDMKNLPITVTFIDEDLSTILDIVAATLNLKVSIGENGYVIE